MSLSRLQVAAEHFGLQITDLLNRRDKSDGASEQTVAVIRRGDTKHTRVRRATGVVYRPLGGSPRSSLS